MLDAPVAAMMTDPSSGHSRSWSLTPDGNLALDAPLVMGILNATPDSFHDGRSDYHDPQVMVESACSMVDDGADIIDVGGESTRPGSLRVDSEEQCRRTTRIIEGLSAQRDCLISIDTTHSAVAAAALSVGARIVNDVSAGTEDPGLLPLVAERGCGVILMHRLAPPSEDVYSHQYQTDPDYGSDGVVQAVAGFLLERKEAALRAGVASDQIVFDPGLGFGKSVEQNLELLRRLPELISLLGRPVLIGASRKSFIGAVLGDRPPSERLHGSLSVAVLAAQSGASLLRCHDVRPTLDALELLKAVQQPLPESGGTIHHS